MIKRAYLIIIIDANHRFCEEEIDWGFTRFYNIKAKDAFINKENRTCLSIFLRIVKDETGVLWHNLIK